MEEKFDVIAERGGRLQHMIVNGLCWLHISDPDLGLVRLLVNNSDRRGSQFQVNTCSFIEELQNFLYHSQLLAKPAAIRTKL